MLRFHQHVAVFGVVPVPSMSRRASCVPVSLWHRVHLGASPARLWCLAVQVAGIKETAKEIKGKLLTVTVASTNDRVLSYFGIEKSA